MSLREELWELIFACNHFLSVAKGGLTTELLENEKVSQLCLTEDEALALGRLGVQLEQMFGGPRDIEWAISNVSV
jgi:phosphoenolpyruvate synthase/pyruvate phosphate dikinase